MHGGIFQSFWSWQDVWNQKATVQVQCCERMNRSWKLKHVETKLWKQKNNCNNWFVRSCQVIDLTPLRSSPWQWVFEEENGVLVAAVKVVLEAPARFGKFDKAINKTKNLSKLENWTNLTENSPCLSKSFVQAPSCAWTLEVGMDLLAFRPTWWHAPQYEWWQLC